MATTGDFDVRVEHATGGVMVLHVSGDLDLASAPALEEVVAELEPALRLVVDLTECSFLDSSGMRVLVAARRTAPGTSVEVVTADPGILRALQIARLDTMLEVHSSLAEALEA